MAALAATVGSVEIVVQVGFELPVVVLQAGITLVVVGLLLLTLAVVQHRGRQWTAHLDDAGFGLSRRGRFVQHPWTAVGSVRLTRGRRITVLGREGQRLESLAVDPAALASGTLAQLLADADARLAGRDAG
ncbi:hypothetical protein SAMN04488543_2307 [Friedmanniella luteola]|uniref:PH domain-containing protein n=1 Tax=Friedmanniella luteola TaxID=546871 RepID=A0A1H1UQ88_9ACTN|nr:hypothetical protein [Friedmanniella luteola]SDS74734.1 hypothetical protein SAMN04488543_2307 [Friedmanniella luteola]